MQISKLVPLASGWLVMCALPSASRAQPCSPAPAWTQSATLPAQIPPRLSTAVSSESTRNRVVAYGGLAPFPSGPLADTWIYDGSNWTLSPAAGPGPRVGHRLSFDPQRGVTVLFGGGDGTSLSLQTWEWDGTAWNPGPDAPFLPRTGFSLAYAGNGRTVLFGGTGLVDDVPTTFDETWVYDGTSWTLLGTAGSPPALEEAAMAYDAARQRVVLFGGNDLQFTQLDQTWELDFSVTPPAWTLSPATGPSARSFSSMTYDPSTARVLLTGGADGQGRTRDAWAYTGTAWTLVASTAPSLGGEDAFSPIATYVPPVGPSRPLVVGWGPQTTYRLDGAGGWVAVETPVLPALRDYALAYDPAGSRTLMFGGANGVNGQVGALWSFDGSAWSFLTSTGPAGREFAALAYDTARSRAVLFGGISATGVEGDTWTYSASAWSPLAGTGPSPRRGHAMAYDPSRDITILYGGADGDGPTGETWVLSNNTWSLVTTPDSPGPRDRAVATYDPSTQRVVLFGGRDENFEPRGDLWAFNGSSWVRLSSSGPEPRTVAALSYDAANQRLVLFGGQNADGIALNDTWVFASGSWTRLDVAGPAVTNPDATGRLGVKSVFDIANARTTFFGGFDGVTTLGDTWSFTQGSILPATITINPAPRSAFIGGSTTFTAAATTTRPGLTYAWRRNAQPISDGPTGTGSTVSGASTSSLTISGLGFDDAAFYELAVTTDCGTVFSAAARLQVDFCPADFDRNGTRNVADIFAFLSAWFIRCDGSIFDPPCNGQNVDFDFDGVNVADIFTFLSRWFAGC